MIAIIDYGSGNLSAIAIILKHLNVPYQVVSEPDQLSEAKSYILPGVGHFDFAIKRIKGSGLFDELHEQVVIRRKPVLGICVGMQLLADFSDEGSADGLGWVRGHVTKIVSGEPAIRLPHMGWNSVSLVGDPKGLFRGVDTQKGFYFLHNYHFIPVAVSNSLAFTYYGRPLVCAVSNGDNVFGVQFHPEKSHANGIAVFKNFAKL
jgi:glutamine amidotransferase